MSSTNMSVQDVIEEGKSLMKTKNNKGPSILSRGTPEITESWLDHLLLTGTHWVQRQTITIKYQLFPCSII